MMYAFALLTTALVVHAQKAAGQLTSAINKVWGTKLGEAGEKMAEEVLSRSHDLLEASTKSTSCFERDDKPSPIVTLHSCENCGTTTHFSISAAYQAKNPSVDQIGVNMRIFDPSLLDGVEIRFPNGASWSGNGEFQYRRSPMTINEDMPW